MNSTSLPPHNFDQTTILRGHINRTNLINKSTQIASMNDKQFCANSNYCRNISQNEILLDDETIILPADYVPSPNDVICGRGRISFHHSGNKKFRLIVSDHVEEYMNAKSKNDKSFVVTSIIDKICLANGRFIKYYEDGMKYYGRWRDIGDQGSKDKVGHAIRDAVQTEKKKIKKRMERRMAMDMRATATKNHTNQKSSRRNSVCRQSLSTADNKESKESDLLSVTNTCATSKRSPSTATKNISNNSKICGDKPTFLNNKVIVKFLPSAPTNNAVDNNDEKEELITTEPFIHGQRQGDDCDEEVSTDESIIGCKAAPPISGRFYDVDHGSSLLDLWRRGSSGGSGTGSNCCYNEEKSPTTTFPIESNVEEEEELSSQPPHLSSEDDKDDISITKILDNIQNDLCSMSTMDERQMIHEAVEEKFLFW